MLAKNRRIQRKYFGNILSQGKRYNSPHFLLYVCSKSTEENSCFSFSISKKVLKKAVDRNLYRRRGYAVIRKVLSNIEYGFDLFFVYKKSKYPLEYSIIEEEILGLLKSARVI